MPAQPSLHSGNGVSKIPLPVKEMEIRMKYFQSWSYWNI